jgi:hypothetical protein
VLRLPTRGEYERRIYHVIARARAVAQRHFDEFDDAKQHEKVREETFAYTRGIDGINTPTVTHRWCAFVNDGSGSGHPGSFHKPLAGVAHGHAGSARRAPSNTA